MGYTTEFNGQIKVDPPLNEQEVEFLNKFAETRRMDREKGPYFVDGSGPAGQGHDPDIRDHNRPPEGQPSLWCQWQPTEDGTAILWDEGEKFYSSSEWMTYLIDHFLAPAAIARQDFPEEFSFLQGHICNGEIEAWGEDSDDHWWLVVKDNEVFVAEAEVSKGPLKRVVL